MISFDGVLRLLKITFAGDDFLQNFSRIFRINRKAAWSMENGYSIKHLMGKKHETQRCYLRRNRGGRTGAL